MRKVVLLRDAQDNLREIHRYLLQQTSNRKLATGFVKELRSHCEKIASLKGTLGRPRDELATGIRSIVHKNYVIFFRYEPDNIEIVNILHGRRDHSAIFERKALSLIHI